RAGGFPSARHLRRQNARWCKASRSKIRGEKVNRLFAPGRRKRFAPRPARDAHHRRPAGARRNKRDSRGVSPVRRRRLRNWFWQIAGAIRNRVSFQFPFIAPARMKIAQEKSDGWLWWAVDRASQSVLGWTLGDRGTETAERLAA